MDKQVRRSDKNLIIFTVWTIEKKIKLRNFVVFGRWYISIFSRTVSEKVCKLFIEPQKADWNFMFFSLYKICIFLWSFQAYDYIHSSFFVYVGWNECRVKKRTTFYYWIKFKLFVCIFLFKNTTTILQWLVRVRKLKR